MIREVMLFLALVCCTTAAIDNCKKGGEYCLNHWDCCTNTCLSYLYKCSTIPKKPAANPIAFSPVAQSAPAAFAPAAIPTMSPDTLSFDSLLEIVFRPLILVPKSGRELNGIESRFGEDKLEEEYETTTVYPTEYPTEYTTTNGPVQCLEIGSKCYRNEECCTERCHGFLHQCVT